MFELLAQLTIDVQQKRAPSLQEVGAWHTEKAMLLSQKYPFVTVLLGLMLLDIITGLIAAFVSKVLCSTASYRGMMGKVQILGLVATAMLMELIIPNVPWGTFVAIFFCVTEAISITENAANSGVPIPKPWVDALKKARADAETKAAPHSAVTINMPDAEVKIEDSAIHKSEVKP